MNSWWRAYNEAVNDPKLQLLSDVLFRAWFNLMCIASANDGKLPALKDIAFTLRVVPNKAAQILAQLHAAGLLDKTETGFVPHNWNGRQYKSDVSTDRVKRFRQRKGNVSSAVSETPPEADTEQIQSRADARAVSISEKLLRTDLMEAFGPSRTPDLSRTSLWLSKGYSTTLILDVVRDGLARKPDIATLNYFDAALAEKHASRPESPSERAANGGKVDMDRVAEMFKKTGVWSRYAGPEPGMTGCKCPPEILAKHGIVVPGVRGMDS